MLVRWAIVGAVVGFVIGLISLFGDAPWGVLLFFPIIGASGGMAIRKWILKTFWT